ncbi:MAG: hypothetical protein MJ175_06930 [Clostridia bacterium]|nr:hypothetical protein [Clostridia bacterium]
MDPYATLSEQVFQMERLYDCGLLNTASFSETQIRKEAEDAPLLEHAEIIFRYMDKQNPVFRNDPKTKHS